MAAAREGAAAAAADPSLCRAPQHHRVSDLSRICQHCSLCGTHVTDSVRDAVEADGSGAITAVREAAASPWSERARLRGDGAGARCPSSERRLCDAWLRHACACALAHGWQMRRRAAKGR